MNHRRIEHRIEKKEMKTRRPHTIKTPRYAELVLALVAALCGSACEKEQSTAKNNPVKSRPSASTSSPASRGASRGAPRPRSLRAQHHTVRSLLKEAPRAELWQDGLFIDLGTRDAHKYTRGGFRTGWGDPETKEGVTLAPCAPRSKLEILASEGEMDKVVLRLRSKTPKQSVSLFLGRKKLGKKKVGNAWSTVAFPLPKKRPSSLTTYTLRFSKRGRKGRAAEVDWVWFQKENADKAPQKPKTTTLKLDRPKRALLGVSGRSYVYYLNLPRKVSLLFDYGAKKATSFSVSISSDGKPKKKIFEKSSQTVSWKGAKVDLSPWGGELVRLELSTVGSKPNEETGAGWGEPELMRKGPAPKVPVVSPAKRARNVIYIVIDTARQDAYKIFNPSTRVSTPHLSSIAKESVRFTSAYANSPWTKPSTTTLLSGLYASTHKALSYNTVLPKEVPLISEHLQDRGFQTGALVANAFISKTFGFERGWDHFLNYARKDLPTEAERLYGDAWKWVQKAAPKGRFFLYIQAMDPHVPYAVPPKYLKPYFKGPYQGKLGDAVTGKDTKDFQAKRIRLDAKDKLYTKALYDGEITYHDEHLGNFIARLRKKGLLKDTLLVITNDHGEELFDRNDLGHGHSLYDEQIRTPLLMRYPKLLPKNRAVTAVTELVDVLPTILDLLGVPQIPKTEGLSLWPLIHGEARSGGAYMVSELTRHPRTVRLKRRGKAARVGRYKILLHRKGLELFDMKKDPGEKVDLAPSKPVALRTCTVLLGEGLAIASKAHRLAGKVEKRKIKAPNIRVDPELRRQLQALAYTN